AAVLVAEPDVAAVAAVATALDALGTDVAVTVVAADVLAGAVDAAACGGARLATAVTAGAMPAPPQALSATAAPAVTRLTTNRRRGRDRARLDIDMLPSLPGLTDQGLLVSVTLLL